MIYLYVTGPDGSDDSSNEDYAPVPQYKDAFSDAIQAALDKAAMEAASRKTGQSTVHI